MRITRSSTAPIATTNADTTATDANTPDPEHAGEDVPDSQAFGQDVTPNIGGGPGHELLLQTDLAAELALLRQQLEKQQDELAKLRTSIAQKGPSKPLEREPKIGFHTGRRWLRCLTAQI